MLFFCFTKTGFGFRFLFLSETSTYCKVRGKHRHTHTKQTKPQKSTKCQGEKNEGLWERGEKPVETKSNAFIYHGISASREGRIEYL